MIQQQVTQGVAVIDLDETSALVASASEPGGWHRVTVEDGITTCDCLGYKHRGGCRHTHAFHRLHHPAMVADTPNTLTGVTIWATVEQPWNPPADATTYEVIFGAS